MKSIFCALALVTAGAAEAQVQVPRPLPTPADFAMQLPLGVSGSDGVVRLTLPQAVYQHAQSPSLDDLRIFNGAGELLPFAFFEPLPPARAASEVRYRDAPTTLFPVHAVPGTGNSELELTVKAAPDGSLLSMSAQRRSDATGPSLSALIVDLGMSTADENLDALQLQAPIDAREYRATLAIERSEDLKLWDAVAHSNVDWLSSSADERLVNDRIEIPRSFGRYLRIRWLEGEPRAFGGIVARWRSRGPGAEAVTSELIYEQRLPGVAGRVAGDFVYTASPAIAASEIGLDLADANSVVPVSIGFYRELPGRKPSWIFEPRIENTFYRLSIDNQERRSSRLAIAPLAGRDWVVRAQLDHVAQLRAPELVLRWRPRTLVFTARGKDFRLAYGADPVRVDQFLGGAGSLDRVAPGFTLEELSGLEVAVPGTPQPTPRAAGPAPVPAVAKDADVSADQRKLILWSVLILGVLVLAGMSWRLFKQMEK